MTPGLSDQPPSGHVMDGEHRLAVRVYYEDTDAGGVVYHANYLRWFERARTEMMLLLGADPGAALAAGEGGYVVAQVALDYRRAARLGEVLVIATRLERVRHATCVVQQRVMRDGQVICEGRLTLAFVDADGRPRRQPAAWTRAFAAATGATVPQ